MICLGQMTTSELPFIARSDKIADLQSMEMSGAIVDPNEGRRLCERGTATVLDREIGKSVVIKIKDRDPNGPRRVIENADLSTHGVLRREKLRRCIGENM